MRKNRALGISLAILAFMGMGISSARADDPVPQTREEYPDYGNHGHAGVLSIAGDAGYYSYGRALKALRQRLPALLELKKRNTI